ncbi:MAG: hypothetical protein AAF513_10400 [Pseudomonadota bacterium]
MSYQVIDEPQVRSWGEMIIVNPVLILFAAMIVPMFVSLPIYGRFWMPFAWLALNGWALGSATLKRELITSVLGLIAMSAVVFIPALLISSGVVPFSMEQAQPYIAILLMGALFFLLYLVVFPQERSYQLYEYLRRGRDG